MIMADTGYLDRFESLLRDGLVKLCRGEGLLGDGRLQNSPDIQAVWNDSYLQSYVADAVRNFNDYPDAALAWAGFLGMAVAHNWDSDWSSHRNDSYDSYYGSRGFDDMDEHILSDVLHLKQEYADKVSSVLNNCAQATLGLIRHEGIESQTSLGFYVLVRAYSVIFEIGAAIEFKRLGYSMVKLH
ncbi:MAG: hypothetical protein MJY41_03390 [Bacteroidales bacterium]|nr:hypothetical protein [Bacteroidales bacterium]